MKSTSPAVAVEAAVLAAVCPATDKGQQSPAISRLIAVLMHATPQEHCSTREERHQMAAGRSSWSSPSWRSSQALTRSAVGNRATKAPSRTTAVARAIGFRSTM